MVMLGAINTYCRPQIQVTCIFSHFTHTILLMIHVCRHYTEIKTSIHGVEAYQMSEKPNIQRKLMLVDFLSQDTTVNAATCSETLQKLCYTIPNKRWVMPNHNVVLLHNGDWPILILKSKSSSCLFISEQIHPPLQPWINPDHTLYNLNLFLDLKWFLASQCYDDSKDLCSIGCPHNMYHHSMKKVLRNLFCSTTIVLIGETYIEK